MTKFPSVEWFQALSERAAADKEEFKRLGYFDANVGVKIDANGSGAKGYVLEFAGYVVRSVRDVADPVAESNFTIEGSLDAWTDMVRNIQDHGEPDLDHTLTRLPMAGVPMQVVEVGRTLRSISPEVGHGQQCAPGLRRFAGFA